MVRRLSIILLYLSLPLLIAGTTYGALLYLVLLPADDENTFTTIFEVPEQATLKQIARDLEAKGLIRHYWAFRLIGRLRHKDTAIMAGEYELSPAMTPEQILDRMVSGKMILRRVTVKEGASMREIGQLFEQAGIITLNEFNSALTNPNILSELRISANSAEGYLFPETYQFPRGTKAKKILSTMVDQLTANWKPAWNERLKELKLTKHQLLTLASIVEKESGSTEEQPLIAAVFHNRLKKGMKLQADPTVIYGIPNFNGNLTRDDLLAPTPYNTYVIEGLPPGPIANPGIHAIEAALYPASTDNLYFVANGQGRHVFSETLSDHNQAVTSYQKH